MSPPLCSPPCLPVRTPALSPQFPPLGLSLLGVGWKAVWLNEEKKKKVNLSEAVIRNLFLTLENIAESAAKAIVAQQKSLDSLAKVVFDYRIALQYLLAERGSAWAVANTTCCTWVNTSEEVETQLHKIIEQATWHKN